MSSSYLVSDKLYYFANEDITQNFPSKSSLNPSPLKKFKIEETVIESVAYLEADQLPQEKEYKDLGREYFDFIYQEYKRRNKIKCFDPIVLFNFWKGLKNQQQQKEDEKFKSTFKSMVRSTANSNKKISLETQKRLLGGESSFKTETKKDPNFKLEAILNSNPDDVSYTLKIHAKDAETELNISNFIEDRTIEMRVKSAKKPQKRALSKKCQERLYPQSAQKEGSRPASLFDRLLALYIEDHKGREVEVNDKILFSYWREMPQIVRQKQKITHTNPTEVMVLLEQAYTEKSNAFCEKLEEIYKKTHPENKNFKRADVMVEFWKTLPNDHEEKIFHDPRQVIHVLEKFYSEKVRVLCKLFSDRYGFEVDNCKDKEGNVIMTKQVRLYKFWKKELGSDQSQGLAKSQTQSFMSTGSQKGADAKKLRKLDFESDENIIFLINEYFKEMDDRNNLMNHEREKEEQRMHQERLEKKKKNAKTAEETEIFYEKLALPKDRLKLGKALLHLRKMFPKDKILLKMILHEFKENKVSKYPLEYDVYDSEEEGMIKGHSIEEKAKAYMKEKEREHEIIEHFMNDIEKYYNEKNQSLLKEKKQDNEERQGEMKVRRYMENIAKTFINMRKRRFEEKIPTLNQYLSEKYIELKSLHKGTVKKMFPHRTYGESKALRKKSFPVSFKRYFFQTVKSFVKKKNEFERPDKKKLPFWAPPSSNRCRLHFEIDCPIDCKFQSLNRVVMNLSKTTKEGKVLQECKGKDKVWELKSYVDDRLKVMTTYSDAKNCTFTPAILSRMPEKHKAFMESLPQYQSWVQSKLSKPKSFEDWVKSMGENFSRRFPGLYKYGVFKRCVNWWRRGEIVKAYKKLAEVFDIDKIKRHFNLNYKELPKESMFTYENLNIDKRKLDLREDLDNKKNINFLYDVYKLITFLEEYEAEILHMKKEINLMLKSENTHPDRLINQKGVFFSDQKSENLADKNLSYSFRRGQIKSHMCPLRDQCPDDIRPRWPFNDNKSILPFGAKCPFAHHVFELKFKRELKMRKQMLKNNLKLLDKHLSSADVVQVPWVPGGRTIVDCIGCGEQLGSKGQKGGYVKKGLCAMCEIRKTITKKLDGYLVKAKIKRKEMTSTQSFKQKQIFRRVEDENFNKKLGFLQRANILYAKERYAEAFAIIIKAVDIVKNEMANDEVKQKNKEDEWKSKLDLQYDGPVTQDLVYRENFASKSQNITTTEPSEMDNEKNFAQKLTLFASRTGVIGEKQLNVNEFINHQIELTYLKIERKFLDKQKDVTLLKQKIDRLEGGQSNYVEQKREQTEEHEENQNQSSGFKKKLKVKKTLMCPQFLETGKCDKLKDAIEPCLYAHNPIELDLIDDEIKINNLQKTIKFCNAKMVETKPPTAWNPTSKQSAIINIKEFDENEEIKRKAKTKENKRNSSTESAKMKMSKVKSIYEKEFEEIAKLPSERHKTGTFS